MLNIPKICGVHGEKRHSSIGMKRLLGLKYLTHEERWQKNRRTHSSLQESPREYDKSLQDVQRKYDTDLVPRWEKSEEIARGHHYKLFKRISVTKVMSHYFIYRIVDEWNSLPDSVVSAFFSIIWANTGRIKTLHTTSRLWSVLEKASEVINKDLDAEV